MGHSSSETTDDEIMGNLLEWITAVRAASIEAALSHELQTPSRHATTSCPLLHPLPYVTPRRRCREPLSRKDRSPCPRPTPLSLQQNIVSSNQAPQPPPMHMHLPSSFSSSLGASSAAEAPAAAPPAAGAAAAPPPEPTFNSSSFTSLPSSALAKRLHQMGSTSGTLAAVMMDWSLSAYTDKIREILPRLRGGCLRGITVMSTPSSARMRAA